MIQPATMKRALIALTLLLCSCGGAGNNSGGSAAGTIPNIEGQWEIVATSALSGGESGTFFYEVNLSQSGSNATASGTSAWPAQPGGSLAAIALYFGTTYGIGGLCGQTNNDTLSFVVGNSGSVSFTLNSGLDTELLGSFQGSGTLSADSQTMSGTFSPINAGSSDCPINGTFTAKRTSPMTGSFTGTLSFSQNTGLQQYSVTATLSESPTNQITITGTANGTAYTLTGSVVGNAFIANGTLDGSSVVIEALYVGSTSQLVVFDLSTGNLAGQLVGE